MQTASDFLRATFSGSIGRAGRYLMVSVVNVINHQLILQLAVNLWGWSGGVANAFAATTAAAPAYFMSRYWVWRVRGRSSLRSEVVPFWIIAILGLVVSSLTAEAADRLFERPIMISVGSIIGYFIVWVIKFLLLDELFDGKRLNPEVESDGAVAVGR
jgi:putative flippase GtrA